jgi:hypothetical protein
MCLVIGPSFQCTVFLMSDRLYYVCVLCKVYVVRILNFV